MNNTLRDVPASGSAWSSLLWPLWRRYRWPARQPSIYHDMMKFEGGKWVPYGTSVPGPQAQGTRHTWASLLIQNGVPKGMIKEMGGWKSDSMVERYAHLVPEHLARHAAVIDDVLSPGGSAPVRVVERQS